MTTTTSTSPAFTATPPASSTFVLRRAFAVVVLVAAIAVAFAIGRATVTTHSSPHLPSISTVAPSDSRNVSPCRVGRAC